MRQSETGWLKLGSAGLQSRSITQLSRTAYFLFRFADLLLVHSHCSPRRFAGSCFLSENVKDDPAHPAPRVRQTKSLTCEHSTAFSS